MKKKYTLKPKLAYVCYRNQKEGTYVARVPVLKISEFGKTPSEALHRLAEMEAEALAIEKEMGNPEPTYAQSLCARQALKRGGKRKNGGRKPKDAPRDTPMQVSVSADDLARFKAAASAEGHTLSTWAYLHLSRCAPARKGASAPRRTTRRRAANKAA